MKEILKSDKTDTTEVVRGETGKISDFSNEKFENMNFKPMNVVQNEK